MNCITPAPEVHSTEISIIMPAFNAAKTISESIESVLSQVQTDWELLVVNDGSSDGTAEIADKYSLKDERIKVIHQQQNVGLSNARNIAIKMAKGNFIAFLDSDDLWEPDKLTLQLSFHKKNPKFDISHTAFKAFTPKGLIKRPFKQFTEIGYKKEGLLFPHIYSKNPVGVLTVMCKRAVLLEVEGFDQNLWGLEDHDLWIRISKNGHKFGYINKTLAYYRISAGGMVQKTGKYKKAYKELIKKHQQDIIYYGLENKTWATYFRYFGTEYFKHDNNLLSRLYFKKSLEISRNISKNSIALVYLLLITYRRKIKNRIS